MDIDESPSTTTASTDTGIKANGALAHPHALTARQERRLVAYLDEQFLQLTRGFKKRSEPTTHLPTLHRYLAASRQLLRFILQIPPVDPSTALRTAYLLHLTGDVLFSIPGYPPPIFTRTEATTFRNDEREQDQGAQENESDGIVSELIDFLDDLDQAWIIVLQGKAWDTDNGVRDVELNHNGAYANGGYQSGGRENAMDTEADGSNTSSGDKRTSTPVSQTERTRLRSLLVGGMAALEEWIAGMGRGKVRLAGSSGMHVSEPNGANGQHNGHHHLRASGAGHVNGQHDEHDTQMQIEVGGVNEEVADEVLDDPEEADDVQLKLQRFGFQEAFDELFSETLNELGGLGGVTIDPTSLQD